MELLSKLLLLMLLLLLLLWLSFLRFVSAAPLDEEREDVTEDDEADQDQQEGHLLAYISL